ncbi:MerR family DNA-binding transcriptional regulator [Arthrospira platensis SPKY1]|nr:MerR family DNA-binding transcriptional regulator [Arthrospira platensis SPKY1]
MLTIGQAARQLSVSVETLRRWEAAGKISATRSAGGQRLFDPADIARIAEERAK